MSDNVEIGMQFDPLAIIVAARIASYADVILLSERLFGAAHVLWPEESAKHAAEIEGASAQDEDGEPEELPALALKSGIADAATTTQPAKPVAPLPADLPRTPPQGIDLTKIGREIRAEWPPGQPIGSDAAKVRRARMLELQRDHKLSVKTIAQLFGLAESTAVNCLVIARKESSGKAE